MAEKLLNRAIDIAHDAHEGQLRKFEGVPYVEHPIRVMNTVAAHGHSEATRIVGVLHDVVEDSEWTLEQLTGEGFDEDVIVPLELLTKTPDLEYEAYVHRVATNPRARAVKLADLFDNMNLLGNNNPSLKDNMRIEKYGKSLLWLARFGQPII